MISDQQQRLRAVDITSSFIVQAPAGSGKTELLTQRYLSLLAHTQTPQEILAITFTRKAAAEMRHRVLSTLEKAKQSEPKEDAAKLSWQLARQVLAKDQANSWELLSNPNRLRIQTIDSLCISLVKQMPLLSRFGTQMEPTENAEKLYQKTAEYLFQSLDEEANWVAAFKNLLDHLDNSVEKFTALLALMLNKRDQWLPHILIAKNNEQLRQEIEEGLKIINQETLEEIQKSFPQVLWPELLNLAQFSAKNLSDDNIKSSIIDCLNNRDTLDHQRKFWLGIADLLLTDKNSVRKIVTKNEGFPTQSSINEDKSLKSYFKAMKTSMLLFLEEIAGYPIFLEELKKLRQTPHLHYDEDQWSILQDLLQLLPIAVAQLRLVFQEFGQVDFIEISQAALKALGSQEEPTDLGLTLDYKIQHILVDEFQDTSITQFRLLEQLIAGWQPQDGRTLFLVGDPMQSIYSFRAAEVGLFLRAKQQGIGQIQLENIVLSENFRSTKLLIDWINKSMSSIFPTLEDISAGAVTYSPAIANDQSEDGNIQFHPILLGNEEKLENQEAEIIVNLLKASNLGKTAILVRARTHLYKIVNLLKESNIAYQAVEIDLLWSQPIIQDLFALTKALLHPADHISWLALLRAPFCGLLLEDLYILSHDRELTLHQQINNPLLLEQLSLPSQERLKFFNRIMNHALSKKQRCSLHELVKNTWLCLRGDQCLNNENTLENAHAYFNFLDTVEHAGDIKNFEELEIRLKKLYASVQENHENSVQVLTIHKAKGLEFDTVILPGLGKSTGKNDKSLLMLFERPRKDSGSDMILAPIENHKNSADSVYDYLCYEENVRKNNEDIRLLYVALTRAKKNLHLLGHAIVKDNDINPPAGSFLKLLWPILKDRFIPAELTSTTVEIAAPAEETHSYLFRLPQDFFKTSVVVDEVSSSHFPASNACWQPTTEISIGALVHQILEIISLEGLTAWPLERVQAMKSQWKSMLISAKVFPTEIDYAISQVLLAITNTLQDNKGRWILDHRQSFCQSEFSLSTLSHFVIDRCFMDDARLWIIDYKVITKPDLSLEQQTLQYEDQLHHYASLMTSLFPGTPIKIALYFPIQQIFHEICLTS
jgi:ATP-dependent helicase/nuclease subunit A